MLSNQISDFGIAEIREELASGERVIFAGFETAGLGDVVQQRGSSDQIVVQVNFVTVQPICQKGRHPANLQRMGHDMIHHFHLAHQRKALFFSGDLHACRKSLIVNLGAGRGST